MSLVTEINRTNTQKENIKKVATQIDDKLVALGGERATDLFDVPNKFKTLTTSSYKKIAILKPDWELVYDPNGSFSVKKTFSIDVPFEISEFFIKFTIPQRTPPLIFCIHSKIQAGQNFEPGEGLCKFKVKSVTANSITLETMTDSYSYYTKIKAIEALVIGK
jgi:hypothetical protein